MASSIRSISRIIGRTSGSSLESAATRTTIPLRTTSTLLPSSQSATHIQSRQTQPILNATPFARSTRYFSTTTPRAKTMGQIRARNSIGPMSWKSALLFVATGIGMFVYFRVEKERIHRKRVAEMSKGVGRPKVGGPFTLKDLSGKEFTAEDLKGKYSFVYFGFTHCPDICPDELDKMAEIIDKVNDSTKGQKIFLPVFITCDPVRDTPEVLQSYLKEFHEGIIGLTGTYDQVKNVCKQYRVYFSTPKDVKAGEDYLVDHSIYFYLMDPEGDFVECIGRQDTPESATKVIMEHINDWKREGKPLNTE